VIFNSLTYLVFLLVVVLVYWRLGQRQRWWCLAACSFLFYAFWRVDFALLMLVSAVVDFVAAQRIEAATSRRVRKGWLGFSLVVNLGLLLFFKYTLFFVANIEAGLSLFDSDVQLPYLEIVLPLGISFYTFQTIAYTIDVYRGIIRSEKNFLVYLVFVTFFPQLVAGPIVRAGELIGQLRQPLILTSQRVVSGCRWILSGLFLKTVLADNLAPMVDAGFGIQTALLGPLDVLTLSFLFGFQIYFDFAAYSQIAIGSARLLGIELPRNFNFPYSATSPRVFWQRWHISLSSWIRDYLYLPLQGLKPRNRSMDGLPVSSLAINLSNSSAEGLVAKRRWQALFVTWAIMGLWHGAAWTFALWGLYHAVFIASFRLTSPIRMQLPNWLRTVGGWSLTLVLSMLAWIPFRADSLEHALALYGRLASVQHITVLGMRENVYLVALLTLAAVMLAQAVWVLGPWFRWRFSLFAQVVDTAAIAVTFCLVFVFLRPVEQFIYFQF